MNQYRYYAPRQTTNRVVYDTQLLQLWDSGADTYVIALQLGIPEHEVANRLIRIREERRAHAQWPECVDS